MREALAAMGREVTFRTGPWARVRAWLERGEIQALPLVGRTPEREALFDFTFPYMSLHGAIVVREDTSDVRDLSDLRGKQVAVMKGDNAEEFMRREDRGITLQVTKTFEEALRELSLGKHDAVVLQRLVALRLIQENGLTDLRVLNKPIEGFRQDFCFAVQEGDRETLALLNEGLALVMADGTFRHLHAKWFAALELPVHRRIVIGGDHNYPPYEYLDEEGRPAGFNVELTRAIAQEVGFDIDIRLGPWKEIREGLRQERIDAIQGMFYSTRRDLECDFSPSHNVVHHVAVVRKGGGDPPHTVSGLKNRNVVVMQGDIMHDFAMEHGMQDRLTAVPTQEDALRELAEGRHDCALVAKLPALYWIKRHGWDHLAVSERPLLSPEYCYAVASGNKALLARISEGLKILEETGEYRRISEKWLGVYQEEAPSLGRALRASLIVLVPLAVVVSAVLLWSWALRKQVATRTEALRESERILNATGKMGRIGGWEHDLASGEAVWTEALYDIIELPYDQEPPGVNEHLSYYPPQDRRALESAYNRAVEKGVPFDLELQVYTATRKPIWCRVQGEPEFRNDRCVKLRGIFQDITERKEAQARLERIAWLLTPKAVMQMQPYVPPYGDLVTLNTSRVILDSVGEELLTDIVSDYLDLLETSTAVYEANGDYALGIFSSGWCRFMDTASRRLCETDDNRQALASGKWLCHESCWADASRAAIETGRPVDIACSGGIRLYAVPVRAGDEIVGSMNFGYGDPPRDPARLQGLASRYEVDPETLRRHAEVYESRPPFIVELAKQKLAVSARLIGEIVERRRAESALKAHRDELEVLVRERTASLEESEIRYRKLFEEAPDSVVLIDADSGEIVEFNTHAHEALGYTRDEFRQLRVEELEAAGSPETLSSRIESLERQGSDGFDTLHQTKDGEIRNVKVNVTALNLGGRTYLQNIWSDITAHKHAERQMARQNEILQAINDLFREARACETYEAVGRVCLRVAERLTGSPFGLLGEINERGLFDTYATSNPGWDACELAASDAKQSIKNMPIRGIDRATLRDGRSRIVNEADMAEHPDRCGTPPGHPPVNAFLGVPLKHGEKTLGMIGLGNKVGGYDHRDRESVEALSVAMVEVLMDMRAKQQIQRLNADLERSVMLLKTANEELEAFAYSVSHDLRSPLRGVDGYSKLLLEEHADALDEDGRFMLTQVRESALQMGQLIDDLLKFSRMGRSTLHEQDCDVDRIARELFHEMQMGYPERRMRLEMEGLLPCKGDESMIREVLRNLLENAVKFTRIREEAVIEIGSRLEGAPRGDESPRIIYHVRDNGIGFDPRFQHKLFEVFQRLHRTEDFEGTGIGLALVKRIVKRHGGRVWAESQPDQGATFCFSLPCVKEEATKHAHE